MAWKIMKNHGGKEFSQPFYGCVSKTHKNNPWKKNIKGKNDRKQIYKQEDDDKKKKKRANSLLLPQEIMCIPSKQSNPSAAHQLSVLLR